VIKGAGYINLNNDDLVCKDGDYVLCKPNTTHAFRNNGDEDLLIAVFRTNDVGDSDMYWLNKQD
jgi:quercetin dioxygenase-like cupin family protein